MGKGIPRLLVASLICASCVSAPTPAAKNAEPLDVVVGDVLYENDLTEQRPTLLHFDDQFGAASYAGGGYQVLIKGRQSYMVLTGMRPAGGVRAELDISMVTPLSVKTPSLIPSAGVTCRSHSGDVRADYYFRVWADGNYSIYRIRGKNAESWIRIGSTTTVGGVPVTVTDPLHVRADCLNRDDRVRLSLTLNDQRVLDLDDVDPGDLKGDGQVGLMLDTGDQPNFTARFTNLVVRALSIRGAVASPIASPSFPVDQSSLRIYSDSFTNSTSGWFTSESNGHARYLAGGGYDVLINSKDHSLRAFAPPPTFTMQDVRVEAEIVPGTPRPATVGVTCRAHIFGGVLSYYYFGLSPTGRYAIFKLQNQELSELASSGSQHQTTKGAGGGRLAGECTSANPVRLSLIVDGSVVLQTEDPDPAELANDGRVGLRVDAGATDAAVTFKSFSASAARP